MSQLGIILMAVAGYGASTIAIGLGLCGLAAFCRLLMKSDEDTAVYVLLSVFGLLGFGFVAALITNAVIAS